MVNRKLLKLFIVSSLCLTAIPHTARSSQESAWTDHCIPLPKEIRIEGERTLPASGVVVRVSDNAGAIVRQAAEKLAVRFGFSTDAGASEPAFEIIIGVMDDSGHIGDVTFASEADRLSGLQNSEQAYVIRPLGESRLALAGLDSRGVYYAVQTLSQLLESRFVDGKVIIPLVGITDWPDMAYRGAWDDFFPPDQVEWMSTIKMNLVDCHVRMTVTDEGRGAIVRIPSKGPEEVGSIDYPEFCRLHAVKFVPIITHLSHLDRTGIYDKFPELIGRGASIDDRFIAPCAAQEKFVAILADWMEALAGRPDVVEISAWLSEVDLQCQCEACREAGQYVMETRAIVKAYRRAQKSHPDIRLRILLTQGSYPTNDKVLAEIPDDVGVVYYDGERTYDSSREPMIYFDLREYAAQGHMVGVCPQLTVSWAVVIPWSSPQFVRARMNEFVDKGVDILSAYATPDLRLYDFNIAAAAEWSWNAHGRDEREFASAWATRKGLKDPEKVAEWAVVHGDTGWDVYGSEVPFNFIPGFGTTTRMIENRIRPVLGEDMFRYFPTLESFDRTIADCERALSIADKLGRPEIVEETRIVHGYAGMIKEMYHILAALAVRQTPDESGRRDLERRIGAFTGACLDTNESIRRWEALFGEEAGGGRLVGTLALSEDIAVRLSDELSSLGVENPEQVHLPRRIGEWKPDDFSGGERATLQWRVESGGAGDYEVYFKSLPEADRAHIHRAALAYGSGGGQTVRFTETCEDKHEGRAHETAYRDGNVYRLTIDTADGNRARFVIADMTSGGAATNGEVWIKKIRLAR